MTDNLPERTESLTELQARVKQDVLARRLPNVPSYAYTRVGIGELALSAQLRQAVKLFAEVLQPLVDNFEAQTPAPLLCSICQRNFGGWPVQVLEDHWNQHTWLQRRMASWGMR